MLAKNNDFSIDLYGKGQASKIIAKQLKSQKRQMTKSSKTIWIINQYAGTPNHGMTFRSYFLAKEFIKYHKVTIFSASFSHVMSNPPSISKVYTAQNISGVNYQWIKVPTYHKSKSFGRVSKYVFFLYRLFFFKTKKIDNPDVIIVSSASPLPIWKAYL